MDTPSGGGRDSRFSMGYNISLLSGETAPEIYNNTVHNRPSTSITTGLTRSSIGSCSAGMQRGLKRTSSDVCYEQDGRQMSLTGDCGSDIVDDGFTTTPQKGSPPSNGKKTKGRVKIKMEYIDNKLRRYTTFSKRKTGIMKKAYELSTLTGTQVMLLVASETGHVYTFATRKLQPMITSEAGKALIQTCLNSPDPCPSGSGGDQRMSATGFEETELSYNIADEEQKEGCSRPFSPTGSDAGSVADSTSSELPPSPNEFCEPKCELGVGSSGNNGGGPSRRSSPPSHLPPAPHSPILSPGNSSTSRGGTNSGTNSTNGGGGISSGSNQSVSSNSFGTVYSGQSIGTSSVTGTTASPASSSSSTTTTTANSTSNTRQAQGGLVYAPPSASLPNGGVLLSVGGGPHYITIPLHLNLPTDLTKSAPK